MDSSHAVSLGLLGVVLGVAGCGGSGGGGHDGGAGEITISGALSAGTVNLPGAAPGAPERVLATSSFAGFQLACMTLSKPPSSATNVVDDLGNVSLTLAAKDVPFGCFVLDPQGAGVATLTFENGSTVGQIASLGDSADLGTILVDSATGVAQVGVPLGGTLVTTSPAGAPCPLGLWSYVTNNSAGTGSGTTWIAKTGSGQFALSVNGVNAHGYLRSFSNVPGTYANGTLSVGPYYPEANTDSACASTKTATISLTANSACTQLTGTVTRSGCGSTGCSCEPQTIIVNKL
jgi:hypothetical protein